MNKPKKNWMRWIALALIPALCGCAIKNAYPTYPVPERPVILFEENGNRYCMSDAELRELDQYVIKLEALVMKYDCEITIINGGSCDEQK